jgi:hypothetical protein
MEFRFESKDGVETFAAQSIVEGKGGKQEQLTRKTVREAKP